MASTGQPSTASLHDSTKSSGTLLTFTVAISSFISNTSGQVSAHNPHPVHKSLSTTAFILHFPPSIIITDFKIHL